MCLKLVLKNVTQAQVTQKGNIKEAVVVIALMHPHILSKAEAAHK